MGLGSEVTYPEGSKYSVLKDFGACVGKPLGIRSTVSETGGLGLGGLGVRVKAASC